MSLIFCNGAPATAQQLGAAALINYGHFTTLQVRDGATLGLHLHLHRLQEDSRALFGQELETDQLRVQLHAALLASAMADASLRVTVFAPDYDFRDPLREVALDVLVAISPPADMPDTGLRVQVTDYVRERPELKHVGTFPLLHLRRLAMQADHDDVALQDRQGRVLEGAFWNLGLWERGGLVWPQGPALLGTRQQLLQSGLNTLGIAQISRPVELGELERFDGAFACNARGQQAIVALGPARWGPHAAQLPLLERALQTHAWQAI
ncbi:aminotransferase class IV family protein [Xanthomonas sp. 3058]|uniref:aminotransferase class IV family protein n=1 Tax=Xanthomonas sp. 3058 TaxID=3035314 RepID=UPI0016193290|nr:aminotransferase class IV family protein [Xanthomonas sp. 3058]MBB5862872.1 branched-subunit amino acid aminotransferase/4-amino-4-deoxychorismate lyase [Xanthomonas sp. 3058]